MLPHPRRNPERLVVAACHDQNAAWVGAVNPRPLADKGEINWPPILLPYKSLGKEVFVHTYAWGGGSLLAFLLASERLRL